jgi:hypothetical protein
MRQAGIFAGQNLPSALAETAGIRLGRKLNIKGEMQVCKRQTCANGCPVSFVWC